MSKHKPDDDKPASTYFELQRRASANPELPGEISTAYPKLPPKSPWSSENPNPPEQLVSRQGL